MKKYLIPSKTQWKNWGLASKLTIIGTYVVIIASIFTLLIYSGNYLYNNNHIFKIKKALTSHEWVLSNMGSFSNYLDELEGEKGHKIDLEINGKEVEDEAALLLMSSLMTSGLMTFIYYMDNTYEMKMIFDKKPYKSKYEIRAEKGKYFLLTFTKADKSIVDQKVEILEINDDRLVTVLLGVDNDELDQDIILEYKSTD